LIARDISERKRADDALRQTAKLEAIGRLAGGLAHDFNNQLHALTGFANFIGRDPNLSGDTRHDLREIQKTAEQMASLTRQLLAFTRQEALNPETLDLNATIIDMEPMLRRLIGSHMEMRLELTHGPQWVRADRAQLAQVVMNLVINARDAMPGGGALCVTTAALELGSGQLIDRLARPVPPGAYVEFAVSDKGCGIAPNALPRIFELFYTTKDSMHGTGLGLATVENIVVQSGGYIQIESALGHGTTITILLPIVESLNPVALVRPRRRKTAVATHHRLLVVDDEAVVRTVVVRTLEAEGYQVLSAENGQAALECLEQMAGKADLMITDIVMPVMGGHELVAEAARRYPLLPIVWMSGNARENEFADPDGRPFLQKPVTADLLLGTIATTLRTATSRSR
jgi:two-component system cell cycle sensor histidine kinase/response regulator CckA